MDTVAPKCDFVRMNKNVSLEQAACQPAKSESKHFNPNAEIPFGIDIEHVRAAMNDFIDFLGFINTQLATRNIPRFENLTGPGFFGPDLMSV